MFCVLKRVPTTYVLAENLEKYFTVTHSFMLVCAVIILAIQLFEAFSQSFQATKLLNAIIEIKHVFLMHYMC